MQLAFGCVDLRQVAYRRDDSATIRAALSQREASIAVEVGKFAPQMTAIRHLRDTCSVTSSLPTQCLLLTARWPPTLLESLLKSLCVLLIHSSNPLRHEASRSAGTPPILVGWNSTLDPGHHRAANTLARSDPSTLQMLLRNSSGAVTSALC